MKITIIIPAYNEEKNIESCLKSILSDKYKDKEIIVVNDDSTDKTSEVVKKLARKTKQIKLINKKQNQGIIKAIKSGLDKARGEIIVKINADSVLSDNLLEKIPKYFKSKKIVAVTGNYKPFNKGTIVAIEEVRDEFFLNKLRRIFSISKLAGPFWAMKKETLLQLNLWETNKINDEGNLTSEIKNKGKIIYDKNLIIRGNFPTTLKELWQRKFKWGENAAKDQYYKHLKFWIRPLYFLILILSIIPINTLLGKIFFSITMLPLIAIFLFSLIKKPLLAIFIPFVFLFSELSYILGVLRGMLKNE